MAWGNIEDYKLEPSEKLDIVGWGNLASEMRKRSYNRDTSAAYAKVRAEYDEKRAALVSKNRAQLEEELDKTTEKIDKLQSRAQELSVKADQESAEQERSRSPELSEEQLFGKDVPGTSQQGSLPASEELQSQQDQAILAALDVGAPFKAPPPLPGSPSVVKGTATAQVPLFPDEASMIEERKLNNSVSIEDEEDPLNAPVLWPPLPSTSEKPGSKSAPSAGYKAPEFMSLPEVPREAPVFPVPQGTGPSTAAGPDMTSADWQGREARRRAWELSQASLPSKKSWTSPNY